MSFQRQQQNTKNTIEEGQGRRGAGKGERGAVGCPPRKRQQQQQQQLGHDERKESSFLRMAGAASSLCASSPAAGNLLAAAASCHEQENNNVKHAGFPTSAAPVIPSFSPSGGCAAPAPVVADGSVGRGSAVPPSRPASFPERHVAYSSTRKSVEDIDGKNSMTTKEETKQKQTSSGIMAEGRSSVPTARAEKTAARRMLMLSSPKAKKQRRTMIKKAVTSSAAFCPNVPVHPQHSLPSPRDTMPLNSGSEDKTGTPSRTMIKGEDKRHQKNSFFARAASLSSDNNNNDKPTKKDPHGDISTAGGYQKKDVTGMSPTSSAVVSATSLAASFGDSSNGMMISEPGPKDILMGRGRPYQNYIGNRKMIQIVEQYREQYDKTPREKRRVVGEAILDQILKTGARFLRKVETTPSSTERAVSVEGGRQFQDEGKKSGGTDDQLPPTPPPVAPVAAGTSSSSSSSSTVTGNSTTTTSGNITEAVSSWRRIVFARSHDGGSSSSALQDGHDDSTTTVVYWEEVSRDVAFDKVTHAIRGRRRGITGSRKSTKNHKKGGATSTQEVVAAAAGALAKRRKVSRTTDLPVTAGRSVEQKRPSDPVTAGGDPVAANTITSGNINPLRFPHQDDRHTSSNNSVEMRGVVDNPGSSSAETLLIQLLQLAAGGTGRFLEHPPRHQSTGTQASQQPNLISAWAPLAMTAQSNIQTTTDHQGFFAQERQRQRQLELLMLSLSEVQPVIPLAGDVSTRTPTLASVSALTNNIGQRQQERQQQQTSLSDFPHVLSRSDAVLQQPPKCSPSPEIPQPVVPKQGSPPEPAQERQLLSTHQQNSSSLWNNQAAARPPRQVCPTLSAAGEAFGGTAKNHNSGSGREQEEQQYHQLYIELLQAAASTTAGANVIRKIMQQMDQHQQGLGMQQHLHGSGATASNHGFVTAAAAASSLASSSSSSSFRTGNSGNRTFGGRPPGAGDNG